MVASWPAAEPDRIDLLAETEIEAVQRLVTEVRRFRSDQGVRPGQRVPARMRGLGVLSAHEPAVRTLLRLSEPAPDFRATASLSVGSVAVEVDLSGTIDVAAERRRLEKDLAAARTERARAEGKLGNESFIAKAPDAVVEKVRAQLAAADADIARIASQLDNLGGAA